MDWRTTYRSRCVDAETAVQSIADGDRIFLTGNCSVPRTLLAALIKRAPQLRDVEICQALSVAGSEYVAPEMSGHLRVNSLFISSNVRKAIWDGRADFTPVLLSEFPLLFKNGILPLDAAFVHLSPPDEHGYCTYGIETGLTRSAAESARLIIAEVNQQMPRMHGDTLIHVSDIDHIVPVDYPLAEFPMSDEGCNENIEKIACLIAERIPDGATLQTGIGCIPDTVLRFLTEKKDLAIHTELVSDGIIDLVDRGVINGTRKTIHRGKIIAGFMLGSKRLYEWGNDFPMIELHRTEYVNNPFVIAKNEKMVAMNSALEVDLTGQICADSIGPKFYSGVGGQLDFIYGASMSNGGLPIIAMPSTTNLRDGTVISRIVPALKEAAGVTTTRNHIHYVVTEYGMVDLYGKSIQQRAQLLISIAHPDFRESLMYAAKKVNYLA
jgi:acetyl-CoA hydrolase